MKIAYIGPQKKNLFAVLERHHAEMTDPLHADVIITYGGDGSMLGAEREYPGIPKYPIRDDETAPLCSEHTLETQLKSFFTGKLKHSFLPKLEGRINGVPMLLGINDVFVHNKNNACALRYRVWIDDEIYAREIVGDGAGVSTVHGSTAYYRSITRSTFRVGIGLAFSNSTELVNHLVLPETAVVKLKITRGPAELTADNSPDSPLMNEGDECEIHLSGQKAEIIGLDIFMCPDCRYLRHSIRKEFIRKVRR